MGTPLDSRAAQADEVLDRLYEQYPDPDISLDFSNRLELLIAVVLSAQCTDERVNGVTADLFETYDGPEAYAEAEESELADAIDSITYYNSKAGYIKSACQDVVEVHDGEVPDTMSALPDLAGVGLGFGVTVSALTVDYAYNSWSSLGGLHQFTLRANRSAL